ncbi:MAG: DNA-binding response regulator [Pyrinomonas sp.]|uniref:sigma-54-dependent transcriptional regulator n=1 Tax=Pyrinomonas sp. TaxID=2080306 RepID=UPI00331A0602
MSDLDPIKTPVLLVVDDDESVRRVLEFQLAECGHRVLTAAEATSALDLLIVEKVDCVITDLRMPGLSGLELLRRVRAISDEVPVIVITAYGDVETAVEAMRAGAFDFITKPFNREQIRLTVEKALAYGRMAAELDRLRRLVHERFKLENVVGDAPRMRRVFDLVERVARSDVTVLLTGESGTGKELIARGIHFASARRRGPFIAVNCAAIPETLVESELFGHRRGAFTGATRDVKGKFEEASGGTLFLDEVSAMPLSVQGKLLRALQEHEIVRLGESAPRKIDVRIIAATNRDLSTMIADGAFREDLYYRLAVVPIELPPLRERREDIPVLVEHFLRRACERHGRPSLRVEKEVFVAFNAYAWPGNVRELENTVERMVVLARGDVLSLEDVPEQIRRPLHNASNVLVQLPPDGISLEAVEREIIRQALLMHGGNQTRAARYLGITRSALIYRMQKYGLAEESAESEAAQTGERLR